MANKNQPKRKQPRKSDVEVLSEVKRVATRTMSCAACDWMQKQDQKTFISQLTAEEQKTVRSAARNGFKIIKGNHYMSHVLKYKGTIMRSNFLPKIHDILLKYKAIPNL